MTMCISFVSYGEAIFSSPQPQLAGIMRAFSAPASLSAPRHSYRRRATPTRIWKSSCKSRLRYAMQSGARDVVCIPSALVIGSVRENSRCPRAAESEAEGPSRHGEDEVEADQHQPA
jgi:hypothetical protein